VAEVILWRIARRAYALDKLGVGPREAGGRWNTVGTAVIYAGCTVGIAALEKFVHLAGVVPADLVLVRIVLPEGASSEAPRGTGLPPGWDALYPGHASMEFGTQWVQEKRSLVLYVPSAVVPEECNGVINPGHGEFASVRMEIEREFHYDSRMFAKRRARPR
jgi:RES domain-containing protein